MILFYCKTPLRLKDFSPVFVALSHSPPPLPGSEWPATCPKSLCINLLYLLFSPGRRTTSWHWIFSRHEAALARTFPASGLEIYRPGRSSPLLTQLPPNRPSWTSNTPTWSQVTSTFTTQQPTPPGSSPPSKTASPPLISTEPQTWASPFLTPWASTPDFPSRVPIAQAPSTWPLPTGIFFPPFAHGTQRPSPPWDLIMPPC